MAARIDKQTQSDPGVITALAGGRGSGFTLKTKFNNMKNLILLALLLVPAVSFAQDQGITDAVLSEEVLPNWLEAIIGAGGFAMVLRLLSLFAPNVTANLVVAVAKLMSPRVGKVITIARILFENSQANSPEGARWSKSEDENFWEAVRSFQTK